MTVAFNSHPKELQDALQVMSEGHIRCLGLAILVAKNVKLGCPVLIFDDAVNAIDDEHRGGIRDTLFDEGLLGGKQIILTCHGEELIKDIEVFIGHKRAGADCLTYTFLPHDGDRVIRVEPGQDAQLHRLLQAGLSERAHPRGDRRVTSCDGGHLFAHMAFPGEARVRGASGQDGAPPAADRVLRPRNPTEEEH